VKTNKKFFGSFFQERTAFLKKSSKKLFLIAGTPLAPLRTLAQGESET
jgi:hypothetical protein